MILYNVTVNINEEDELDWLQWMTTVHIPEVLATGMFVDNKLFKLISPPEEQGITYSIQYFASSLQELDDYLENYAPDLIQKHAEKYQDKFVAFRTVLELVTSQNPDGNSGR